MMDWYFGREDIRNFIVPNDQKFSTIQHADERSSCPNEWLQWEADRTKHFLPANKFPSRFKEPVGRASNSSQRSLFEIFDMESSAHDGEGSSSQSANDDLCLVDTFARTSEASFCDEQMDDFWDSAFINDPLNTNGLSNSHNITFGSMSFGNLEDILMDPHDSLKDTSLMDDTCYSKMSFSLINDISKDGNQLENVSPSLVTDNFQSPKGSPTASLISVLAPAEQSTSEIVGHLQENEYFEATALHELEDVMTQLNTETRICFRDALYRLAKLSKQHHTSTKYQSCSVVDCESSCHDKTKLGESETNIIDRTVANLMFNNPNSGPPRFLCPGSVDQCAKTCQEFCSYDDVPKQLPIKFGDRPPASLSRGIKLPSWKKGDCGDSHPGCIMSYLMPNEQKDHVPYMNHCEAEDSVATVEHFHQAEDSVASVEQFGLHQHHGFKFVASLPRR